MKNALIIDAKDNVAVVIEQVQRGGSVICERGGQEISLTALEDITIYHKVALCDIAQGEPVVKYGEHIGIASCGIRRGEHVHIHNLEGRRENLEGKAVGEKQS